jgi:hypothetical protein
MNYCGSCFEEYMNKVERGKKIIEHYIVEDNQQIGLIFPEYREDLILTIYKYIYLLEQKYQYISVFTVDELPDFEKYTKLPYKIIKVNVDDMDGIVRYASMMELNSLRIMSLTVPVTQRVDDLIGFKDIDLDKVVLRGLFEIMEDVHKNGEF